MKKNRVRVEGEGLEGGGAGRRRGWRERGWKEEELEGERGGGGHTQHEIKAQCHEIMKEKQKLTLKKVCCESLSYTHTYYIQSKQRK